MPRRGPAYGRTTITVPRDLKRRMRAFHGSVNWSAVACRAFSEKVDELSLSEKAQSMDDVVSRLKRLKAELSEGEAYKHGHAAGRDWAMNQALPDQLERIESFRNSTADNEWLATFRTRKGARDLALSILGKPLDGGDEEHPRRRPGRKRRRRLDASERHEHRGRPAVQFWRSLVEPGDVTDTDYFRGFAEGAIEVWRDVRDRL